MTKYSSKAIETATSEYKPKIGSAFLPGTEKARLFGDYVKTIVALVASAFLSLSIVSIASASQAFPFGPDPSLTPGSLCNKGKSYRYRENIRYCARDVESDTKKAIIAKYDNELGFSVGLMEREQFKIDHYIPLCMGGSNEVSNLWPQHVSVYQITDPIEQVVCEKIAANRIRQAEAIEVIRRLKANPAEASALSEYLHRH